MRILTLYCGERARRLLPLGFDAHIDDSPESIEDVLAMLTDTINTGGGIEEAPIDIVLIVASEDDGIKYLPRVLKHQKVARLVVVLAAPDVHEPLLVEMLMQGADLIERAPISASLFSAKLSALYRVYHRVDSGPMRAGPLYIDPRMKRAFYIVDQKTTHIHLTGREYMLLESLMRNPGYTRSKEQLMTDLYGFDSEDETPEIKIVDVFICKLRAKIDAAAGRVGAGSEYIGTVWGRGYGITVPPSPSRISA